LEKTTRPQNKEQGVASASVILVYKPSPLLFAFVDLYTPPLNLKLFKIRVLNNDGVSSLFCLSKTAGKDSHVRLSFPFVHSACKNLT
jgi:hypothetical protein